jgi:hypothetical protein
MNTGNEQLKMNKGQNKAYFKLSLIRIISYLTDYLI